MLKEFKLYLRENTNYHFTCNQYQLTNSIVINIENDQYIARFTLWDDLSCISEIINIDADNYVLNKRDEFLKFDDLICIFNKFTNRLSIKQP